jgi:hypothetical protein
VHPTPLTLVGGARSRADGLSEAQAHALLRCAPLTSAEFKAQRQLRAAYGGPKHFDIASRLGFLGGAIKSRRRRGVGRLAEAGDRAVDGGSSHPRPTG